MNVKIVKLINGDEVIGMLEASGDGWLIKKPAMVGMVPGQNGQPTLGLAEYIPLAEERALTIADRVVLYIYTPKKALINAYNEMFGNGIVSPPNSGLILPGQ